MSEKTEPLEPLGVAGSAWRARVAQLGTLVSAWSEVDREWWLDAAWRGAAGGSFEAAEPGARGLDHRQAARLGCR